MSALKAFLLGLTTRHLGTKLLALLLSIGLFSAVQLSQRGAKEIPELKLQLKLADELRGEYVLLTPLVEVKDIRITGLRSKVNPLHRQYLQQPAQRITINDRFLRRYGVDLDIPITAALFKDEALMGEDIDVTGLKDGQRIELDTVVNKQAVIVEVNPDTSLQLPDAHDYQGTLPTNGGGALLVPKITPSQVSLRGPKKAFPTGNPKIVLDLGNLSDKLRRFVTRKEKDTAIIDGVTVNWKKGDIDPDYVKHVRVDVPGVGEMSAAAFQASLVVKCEVVRRKVLKEVPIPILWLVGKNSPKLDEWRSLGNPISVAAIEDGVAVRFALRMPQSMADDQELLKNLVLILNVAEAEDVAGELIVPLAVRSRRPADETDVLQIEIVGPAQQKFTKK